MIPWCDPRRDMAAQRDAILRAMESTLDSGSYILGPQVDAFEKEFAAFNGCPFAVGVANGTDALTLGLMALGVGPQDEVLVPAHTATATAVGVLQAGATPVLCDVDPRSCTLDIQGLENALGPRTRALIVVHLYGQPADMDGACAFARRHGLRVVEDCAQAHGARTGNARVGTVGDVGCFSFYPTKNLGAVGDGGAVVTRDEDVHARLLRLRQYGWKTRYLSDSYGINSRLDEMQAAVLRVKLPRLDAANQARRALASHYDTALAATSLELPQQTPGTTHVYHLYAVRLAQRDALKAHLQQRGVGTAIHYPYALHQQAGIMGKSRVAHPLPNAERLCQQELSLPLFPTLRPEEQAVVVDAVRTFAQESVR